MAAIRSDRFDTSPAFTHAADLLQLLQQRFGPLPDPIQARIADAELATLQIWMARVLEAESLQEALLQ
ncbi:MAG: hypothetical protein G8237_08255 [Magnetococcales bacterium]|nr:hypothetical protein [Magnetococcales bacterium]